LFENRTSSPSSRWNTWAHQTYGRANAAKAWGGHWLIVLCTKKGE
jgi:hypothetical protein